jgi:hypothetical protein
VILLSRVLADRVRPSPRWLLFCAALFAVATIAGPEATHVAAAASPSPGAGQGQLFGARPLHEGHTTLPGGHFNFALVPGGTISDGVVVENFSDHSLDFHIYGADLLTASGGGLAPAQPNVTMQQAGAWIAVSTPKVTIPAHSQFTDSFTLTLPSTVSPGQHLGAVVASAAVGASPQGSTIEARIALTTVVTVPGTAHPSASLGPLSRSTPIPEELGFDITLSNTGNLLLTYAGSVVVYDGDGHRVGSLPLAPSDAYVVPAGQVPLAAVWTGTIPRSGKYSARATVTILADGKPVGSLTSQSLEPVDLLGVSSPHHYWDCAGGSADPSVRDMVCRSRHAPPGSYAYRRTRQGSGRVS